MVDLSGLRKQYHFRPGEARFDAWDVDRLIELAEGLPVEPLAVDSIAQVDTNYWFSGDHEPTVRAIIEQVRLIREVETQYPIIIDPDGTVMDGMHRIARAILDGRPTVDAVRLPVLPPPDYRNVRPEDLSYDR